jgi:predicted RNA methylase
VAIKIDTDTLAQLDRLEIAGKGAVSHVRIVQQLDRERYTKVNKVLMAAGGKWNRSARAHLFTGDPTDLLEHIVLTGEYRNEQQDFGVFYTPASLAARAADALEIKPGKLVLEPSAGMGALARAASDRGAQVVCVDFLPKHAAVLEKLGFGFVLGDFLLCDPADFPKFDGVLMNPPFAKQADAQHVLHALKFLKPGGRLVAIMSASVTFRDTPWYNKVRELAASIEPLPPGSFKDSGTSVNAVLVVIQL